MSERKPYQLGGSAPYEHWQRHDPCAMAKVHRAGPLARDMALRARLGLTTPNKYGLSDGQTAYDSSNDWPMRLPKGEDRP